ncbi:hypothetical protein GCM10007989_09480 [Devosia pacifica]|uniref:DUF2442 domain-containing protein n=1 Tax=Devosia pacifica TaxID=1335967 RepID=A0A918S152_9HYPH|nr:DUF2442 domain-containing protein [Devosia pacifica]GHA16544.1 hypothetical protein GCM10007989_09480 [Devosia pacifica]
MPHKITSVRTAPPFKLQVQFEDNAYGVFDCSHLIEEPGSGTALKDRRYFGKVQLENGVPTWPNHYDISPDWIREELERTGGLELPRPVRRQPSRRQG